MKNTYFATLACLETVLVSLTLWPVGIESNLSLFSPLQQKTTRRHPYEVLLGSVT